MVIEISRVHGLCPDWLRVSRLKDSVELRQSKTGYCAPWDLGMFVVPNNYQQSLLGLAISSDTRWDLDFYAYDARSDNKWISVGLCGSGNIFERAYESFQDRHPRLLLKGTLVNTMFAQMIVNDSCRLSVYLGPRIRASY